MSATPWTPGPWWASPVLAAGSGYYTIRTEASRPVARIEPAGGTTNPDADARLIAAAPEMAALLARFVEAVEDEAIAIYDAADARALLARIRGEA